MAVNKVIYGAEPLIDLTRDTVTAATLAAGKSAHDRAGNRIFGTASMGDIQSVDVSYMPTPRFDIIGSIYKYNGEYYCCTWTGTRTIYPGQSIDGLELTFPPADDIFDKTGSINDYTPLFTIGFSDSDYVTCNILIYGGYDAQIEINGTTTVLNQSSETVLNLSQYYGSSGDRIIEITSVCDTIFNTDITYEMVNITTGNAGTGGGDYNIVAHAKSDATQWLSIYNAVTTAASIDTATPVSEILYQSENIPLAGADSIIDGTITSISNDRVTYIRTYAFYGCTALTTVTFSAVTSMGQSAFYGCTALTTAVFPVVGSITRAAFYNCSSLTHLILPGDMVVELETTNAFTGSAIKNGTGYVYVPDDLVDSYKAAANWSTYAAQIKGLSELEG